MTRAIVIFESKYGNTRQVAEGIVEGMKNTPGLDVILSKAGEVKRESLAGYDGIILGAPNHMGAAVKSMRKFIDAMESLNLVDKKGAVFDTYMYKDIGKAVTGMEKQLGQKVPGLKLVVSGLSLEVKGMKGPLADGELANAVAFGRQLAKILAA